MMVVNELEHVRDKQNYIRLQNSWHAHKVKQPPYGSINQHLHLPRSAFSETPAFAAHCVQALRLRSSDQINVRITDFGSTKAGLCLGPAF